MNSFKAEVPKKLLLVRCDRIGDLLLTVPIICYLHEKLGQEISISMLVNQKTSELIQGHPQLQEVLTLDKTGMNQGIRGTIRLVRQLRKRKFDAAMVFHPTLRVHFVLFLAEIPRRVGYPLKGGKWLLTDFVPDQRHLSGKHEVENVFDFVERSPWGSQNGPRRSTYSFWIAQDKKAQQKIEQELLRAGLVNGKPFVMLHPGASDPCKCWPKDRFIEAGRCLKQHGFEIVIVTGPSDAQLGRQVAKGIPTSLDFSGKTTLLELTALLKRSRLLISNDSGPVHMAVAVGTPVISIFGRDHPGLGPTRWRPLGEHDRFLFKDVGTEEENLSAITVDEVVKEALEILSAEKKC